nr:hypothetical protein [Tanacetum cinerariifolium]
MYVHNSKNGDDYVEDTVTLISKLDISDLLHLHPNDTTALTIVLIKLKGTGNYQVWSCFMLLALEGKNKIGFIDGTCKGLIQMRSSILSREVLPDVKSAYATISTDESYRVTVGSIAGENQHMTYTNKELDNILDISHLKIKVGHPNGTEAFISKIRNLKLSNGLTLYGDLNLKNVLGIGEQCEGLYYYNDQRIKSNNSSFRYNVCYLSMIGTTGLVILQNLAKQTREPFSLSDHTSKFLGDLVHLDLWGPYKVTSSDGFRYFLTVVDDYTRVVWKSQSDSSSSSVSGSNVNTADFPIDNPRNADSSDNFVATQNEENYLRTERPLEISGFLRLNINLVVRLIVICLLNIVMSHSWPIFQIDVNNALLYGDLDEIISMKPPDGYFPSGNKVYKLKKSLYGLKQAPKQWNAKLTSTLIEKDLGKLKYFLGIEVVDIDKGICLNQEKYVLDLLSKYGMLACKPVNTPLLSKLVISNKATEKDPILENIIDYQKLMDFKILRYLKGCPGLGIHIVNTSGMFLNAFSDADWAKCVITRKSITGYCVFLNNSRVSWKSKKHNTISKSTTEAEYRALTLVISEVI